MTTASASQTFAPITVIKIDGRDFGIGPIDLDCLIACVGEMQRLAGDPFAVIMPRIKDLPEDLGEKLFREALEIHNRTARATPMAALVWALDDPAGLEFLLWFLLNRSAPGMVPRDAVMRHLLELLFGDPKGHADLVEQIGQASGYLALSKAVAVVHRAAADRMQRKITGPSSGSDSSALPKPEDGDSAPPTSDL